MRRPLRNYFSRREQWRLFALVMGLGLVIVLMREAIQVENWHWLTDAQTNTGPREKRDYDTIYQPTLPATKPDAVRITSNDPPQFDTTDEYFPGVNPTFLAQVEDNRTHKHPGEAAAWFNLWQVLHENEDRFIDPASAGKVTFGELFEQPDIFRGKLVSVGGTARRAEYVAAAKNNRAQIEGYYRLVLRMGGGPERPVFLYTLHVPDHFPLGEEIDAPVQAIAFFYKNWLYEANGLSWIAPVLLAKNIRWQPPPPTGTGITVAMGVAITIGLALFSALIAWWLMRRSAAVSDNLKTMRTAHRSPPGIDPTTVEKKTRDHLQDLAAQELQNDH
jgi:hypothetical protein